MTRYLSSVALPLFVLAAASQPGVVQAQSVQDFQLPPNPTPSPSPSPTVQGPVDSESGPVTPRATVQPIPTPTPSARPSATPTPRPAPAPTRTPTARPSPTLRLPAPTPAPTPTPSRIPRPQPSVVESPAPVPPPAPTPIPSPETSPEIGETDSSTPVPFEPGPVVTNAPEPAPVEEPANDSEYLWWTAALAALVAGGAALIWRRRQANAPVPTIEPPRVRREPAQPAAPQPEPVAPAAPAPAPTPAPAPAAAIPPAEAPPVPIPAMTEASNGTPISVRFEPLRLSRSVMAATLYYRATILNRGAAALNEVVLEADLGSASGGRPVDEQVLDENTPLTPRHVFGRLATGQSARFEGSVQIPLAQADVIRQGNTALLVPLMRLRATAKDAVPFARTFAVGQLAQSGSSRLQPFRLDEGLRSWEPLAQRVLDRPLPTA